MPTDPTKMLKHTAIEVKASQRVCLNGELRVKNSMQSQLSENFTDLE